MRVQVVEAVPMDVQTVISGYGEAKVLNTVFIASETAGKVMEVHPRLETGEVVKKGELLFKIDSRDYAASLKDARASVAQWENTILRLKKQFAIDVERRETIFRNKVLAEEEFERTRRLLETDEVGTRSGVDRAEQAYNAAKDQADQMAQAIALYPIRIKEAESTLASTRARAEMAAVHLKRCQVRAPFTGRIAAVSLEAGQYVTPGQRVVTLADDTLLEIQVPLDSRDARKWLRFNGHGEAGDSAWFSGLRQVPCEIEWTEGEKGQTWTGRLHRVVKFEQKTRTLTVAVRIDAASAIAGEGKALPLVEGMFCRVGIPGRVIEDVFKLPRWAVSFKNTIFIADSEGRLKTVPVETARAEGEFVYIDKGITEGDLVIVTRLIDPLENSLLEIQRTEKGEKEDNS